MAKNTKTNADFKCINPDAAKALQEVSIEKLSKLMISNIIQYKVVVESGRLLLNEIRRRGFDLHDSDIKKVMSIASKAIKKDKDLFELNEKGS